MSSPDRPQPLNQLTAVTYVKQYHYQRTYNALLDENTAELNLGCSAHPLMAAANGYYVVVGCGGAERLTPGPNATHLGAVGEIAAVPVMYFVNETTIIPVSHEDQTAHRPTTDSTRNNSTNHPCHIYIYNIDQSGHRYNITLTDVSGESPTQHSTYVRQIGTHDGRKIVRAVEQRGRYQVSIQTEQAAETFTWQVGTDRMTNGIVIIITPDGAVVVKRHPRL